MTEDQAYEQLKKLGSELKVPVYEAFWRFDILKDGELLSEKRMRSHSLVRNAYNLLYYYLCGVKPSEENGLRLQFTDGNYYTTNLVLGNSNNGWQDLGNGLRAADQCFTTVMAE